MSTPPIESGQTPALSPQDPLSRREFEKLSLLTFATALGLDRLFKSVERTQKMGLLEQVRLLNSLDIDPGSVEVKLDVNDRWETSKLNLSFNSANLDLIPAEQRKLNSNPRAAKVNISVDITNQDNIKWQRLFHEAKTFFQRGTQIVNALKNDDARLALSYASIAHRKLLFPLGFLAAAGLACELAGTQTPPETIATLENLFTPTPQPTKESYQPPELQPTPQPTIEIVPAPPPPEDFRDYSTHITAEYLSENADKIYNPELQPSPTVIPPPENPHVSNIDPSKYTELAFANADLYFRNPIDSLRYIAAQIPRNAPPESKYGITWFQPGVNNENPAFSDLTIPWEKTSVEFVVKESVDDDDKFSYPRGLTIHPGSEVSILGRGNDGSIAIAFDEYFPRKEGDLEEGVPRIRFAVLSQSEFGRLSEVALDRLNFIYNPSNPDELPRVSFKVDSNAEQFFALNSIDDEMMEVIRVDAGDYWVDTYPKLNENGETVNDFFPNPVVTRIPDVLVNKLGLDRDSLVFELITNNNALGSPGCRTVLVKDLQGKEVLVANYNQKRNVWEWDQQAIYEYILPSATTQTDGNFSWTSQYWTSKWIDGGSIEVTPDPLGRYDQVTKHVSKTSTRKIRAQLDKWGPKLTGPLKVTIPVCISDNCVPGNDGWINLLSVFNKIPDITGDRDFNLLCVVNIMPDGKLALESKLPFSGSHYQFRKTNYKLNSNEWYDISIKTEGNEVILYVDGEEITRAQLHPETEQSEIAGLHGGLYGEKIPIDAYLYNGPIILKVYG